MSPGAQIVAAARGWLGTRFHHQGRVKKTAQHAGGVDCLGLLIGVAQELQLVSSTGALLSAFDKPIYSHYPDTHYLRQCLDKALHAQPINSYVYGDIILLSVDHHPQHLAILSDRVGGYGIIHAYAPARAVVEHMFDEWWQQRMVAVYRIP